MESGRALIWQVIAGHESYTAMLGLGMPESSRMLTILRTPTGRAHSHFRFHGGKAKEYFGKLRKNGGAITGIYLFGGQLLPVAVFIVCYCLLLQVAMRR